MDIKKKTAGTSAEARQYVTFRVGPEEYGLDINSIAEVIRPLKITPLPRMPQFIEGVVNLRSAIIPVVDLRRRFEAKAARDDPRKARMMITKGALREGAAGKKALLGLVVDSVSEVLHLSPEQIDRPPEAATGRNADFIAGMGKLGDRLIILIDLAKILTRHERDALVEAGREEHEKAGK